MKWLRALAPVAAAFVLVWLLAGAQARVEAPGLVRVLDMTPSAVEAGEVVALLGDGFPAGKPARVTFRGVLHRPGQRSVRGAEVVLTGRARSDDRVDVPFGESAATLFAGATGGPIHTTFEGDVEVAFAAAAPGASPVAGVLTGVTLDVTPAEGAARAARDGEGERVLGLLGVRLASRGAAPAGLGVESVAGGSRAEAAGLSAGDVIVSFDGVRVASAGDVLPAPGESEAVAVVRHAGADAEATSKIRVEGLRTSPTDLVGSALVVLTALVAVILFAAPLERTFGAPFHRALGRLRARVTLPRSRRRGISMRGRHFFWAVGNRALPQSIAIAMADAAACALLLAMPFGQYLVAARLDVGVLFVGVATALALAVSLSSGSIAAGVRGAVCVVLQHVPAAIAVAGVVFGTGSLRVQEIEHAQGGWPWEWLAFRHPGALVALGLLLACATIEPRPDGAPQGRLAALIDSPEALAVDDRSGWGIRVACRVQRVVVSGLASVLFLGGWLLPGLSPAQQDNHPALQLAGAAWLLAKTWGIVFAIEGLVWGAPSAIGWRQRTRHAAIWLAPLSLASFVSSAAWTWCAPPAFAQPFVSASLVALTGVAAAALCLRVRHALLSNSADGHLSEFL